MSQWSRENGEDQNKDNFEYMTGNLCLTGTGIR